MENIMSPVPSIRRLKAQKRNASPELLVDAEVPPDALPTLSLDCLTAVNNNKQVATVLAARGRIAADTLRLTLSMFEHMSSPKVPLPERGSGPYPIHVFLGPKSSHSETA